MTSWFSAAALCSVLHILVSNTAFLARDVLSAAQSQAVNAEAEAMADFAKRVEAYVALHKKVAATVPSLSDNASAEDIDAHERAFGERLAQARAGAKQGDVFTPAMQAVARRLMQGLFQNAASRRQLRDSLMDDNPSPSQVHVTVNGRYPDEVPLSTMPPEVLKGLPRLPSEVQYRFVGETLILLDPEAHIVVDFVTGALPR